MLDFKVKTFLTVCQTRNYTQAAKLLHITQPTVSQHIAFLEKEYGTPLFEYEHHKLSLTKAGTILQQVLSTRMHDDAILHERIHALSTNAYRQITLGMTLTAGEYIVAKPLSRLLLNHPELKVSIVSADTEELLHLLDKGTIDCAFVEGLFDQSLYKTDTFSKECFVCACASSHELNGQRVRFEDLFGLPLLVREKGSGTRAILEHALTEQKLSLNAFVDVNEIGSLGIIKVMLSEGLGISFLYEAALEEELDRGQLGIIALDSQTITHDISFVRLKHSAFEHEYYAFFKELKACKETLR